MKTTITSLLLCLVWHCTFAQSPNPWETKLQAAKTDTAKLRICIVAGEVYRVTKSSYDSANYFYQKGLSINKKIGTNKLSDVLFLCLGNLKYQLKNYDQAESYYKQSQQVAQQQHDTTTYRIATFNKINVTADRGYNLSAIKQYLEFDRTTATKTHQDSVVKCEIYRNLLASYRELEDKQKSNFYLQKGFTYNKTPYDSLKWYSDRLQSNLIFNSYLDTNAYSNIIRLSGNLNLPKFKLSLFSNICDYYIKQKKYDKAMELAQKVIKMAGNNPELETEKMFTYQNISEVYTGKKQYQKALYYQLKMTDYLEKDVRLKYIAYKQLVIIYVGLGNYKKAYEYSNKIAAHEEEVKGDRNKQAVAEIDAELAAMEKQAQLVKSEQNAKVQQTRIDTEQKQKTIVFGLLVLCLGLLGWAFWSFQKQKKLGTLLKQEKQKLETKTQELTEANQTKDKIFAVLGHDLHSPLNDLKMLLMLFQVQDITPKKMTTLMQSLTTKIESVQSMMNNLLQWSLLELQHENNHISKVSIDKLIKKVIVQLYGFAEKKNIVVESYLQPLKLLNNAIDLEIILRNLLSNAIKFTPVGGDVSIKMVDDKEKVEIIIKNTGDGLPPQLLNSSLNYPKSTKGTAGETGVGLGLKICKELVKKNNGEFAIKSVADEGVEVHISFINTPSRVLS